MSDVMESEVMFEGFSSEDKPREEYGMFAVCGHEQVAHMTFFKFLPITFQSLKKWRIYIGRNSQLVPSKSIIIFPWLPETLSCGLAGILTIKKETQVKDNILENLSFLFEEAKSNRLDKLLYQSISLEKYLGGLGKLEDMDRYVLYLKQGSAFEHIFFLPGMVEELTILSKAMSSFLLEEEELIEKSAGEFSTGEMEHVNNSLTFMKDSTWALKGDILSNIDKILYLSGCGERPEISQKGFIMYRNVNLLLNSIDRLEVRGRDSAGIQITFTLRDKESSDRVINSLKENDLYNHMIGRLSTGDLLDGSIHLSDKISGGSFASITFTYKRASVTGELGENTSYIRNRIRTDQILRAFIKEDIESEMYLAHTRWASVGSVTEENCHPVNNFTYSSRIDTSSDLLLSLKEYPYYGSGTWSINVALNGDIDNYKTLRLSLETDGFEIIDRKVTTDTKMIPLQIEKYLYDGYNLEESFRLALNDFEGSHAIAMQSNLAPVKLFLALTGSGQSLYVGLCDDQYMFSSEIYCLVEQTPYFIKMDGESERIEGNPLTKGQIFLLNKDQGNALEGINTIYYDGHPLEISEKQVQKAEITTRDIDRKDYPHFLLKEILEAPLSARKTLRGKYNISSDQDGKPVVIFNLRNNIIPEKLRNALVKGDIKNIFVIGQGTAAVAGAAIAEALSRFLKGCEINIAAKTASELSGFFLEENLTHTLVIAVTQSGTTTDTNRAVAMARERGAHLIAILNRRQSDITHVTDRVFYTSDGRDIEMSVASTKAFYSQIVAGYLLALYFAQILGMMSDKRVARELSDLGNAPDAIRHQAKTVTVGTSRKREMLEGIIFDLLSKLGFSLENLTSKDGTATRRLQKVITGIKGHTLYAIENLDIEGKPGEDTTISISGRNGVSLEMKSRFEKPGPLSGTKKRL